MERLQVRLRNTLCLAAKHLHQAVHHPAQKCQQQQEQQQEQSVLWQAESSSSSSMLRPAKLLMDHTSGLGRQESQRLRSLLAEAADLQR
jgi:hypothetical protein